LNNLLIRRGSEPSAEVLRAVINAGQTAANNEAAKVARIYDFLETKLVNKN